MCPAPPLAQTLAAQAYPVSMMPRVGQLDPAQPQAPRERYLAALEIFQALARQSDPWLRVVALDLIARAHTHLGAWKNRP